jgi:hypothetical protein
MSEQLRLQDAQHQVPLANKPLRRSSRRVPTGEGFTVSHAEFPSQQNYQTPLESLM